MTLIDPQPSLWDEVTVTHQRPSSEEAFAKFCRRNPRFMRTVAEQTHELWLRGNTRVSMKLVFELIRMSGKFPKIDNSWTSLATRRLVEDHPELAQLFVIRKRRGES